MRARLVLGSGSDSDHEETIRRQVEVVLGQMQRKTDKGQVLYLVQEDAEGRGLPSLR